MFQRMIGLDIGSYSLKVVLLQRGFKGPSVERCVEWPLAASPTDFQANGGSHHFHEAVSAGLQKAGLRAHLGRELVVSAVPQRSTYTRLLRLPFTDPQQIAQTVPFEMENQIPIDLEDVVVDYHPLAPVRANGSGGRDTTVLVTALPRAFLKRQLEELQRAGVDPKAFEVDCLALYNFARHYFKETEGDLLLADVGASKTSLCIMGEGSPRMIRTLWFGGAHLTQALARALGLSDAEAEREKMRAVLPETELEDNEVSSVLRSSLQPLVQQLTATLHIYAAQSGRSVRHLYLCGGSAKLAGLGTYLSRELQVQPVSGPGLPEEETFAVGIGLALKESLGQKASRIRFRTGEFSYRKEQAQTRRQLVALGVGGALLLSLAAGDLYLRYHFKEARYQTLRSEVREIFERTFPGVRTIVNEVEQTKAAQRELEKKAAFFGRGEVTVLDLMEELTRRIPQDTVVEVQELLVEKDAIRLEAQTPSFEAVEKFKASLIQHEGFRDVDITDAKMSADQASVRFRMQIALAEGI